MPVPRRALAALAVLLLAPQPGLALAPPGLPDAPLPELPLPPEFGAGVAAERVVWVRDGEGEPFPIESPWPFVVSGGARSASRLALPEAAAAKVDARALDVLEAARSGALAPDGTLGVLVRGDATAADALEGARVHAAMGLVTGRVPLEELAALALLPGVERVFADHPVELTLAQSVPLIRANLVHARTDAQSRPVRGTGVVVAIVDTGVDYTHADLGGCLGPTCKVKGGFDYVNDDLDPKDDNGHGTHVAATAAGAKGVAPGASILAYKVCNAVGSCSRADIIDAIEDAVAAGADVISMSLGGPGTSDGALSGAADWAVQQGVVVVVAAGNEGPGLESIGEPGASLLSITVGATEKDDALAEFSSRGPVFGSNGAITGVKPDILAPGVSIEAAVPNGTCDLCAPSGYRAVSGTSMATPHVSGVAALLLQGHPAWTPADVKAAILANPVRLGHDPRAEGEGRVDAILAYEASLVALETGTFLGASYPSNATFTPETSVTYKNLGTTTRTVTVTRYRVAGVSPAGAWGSDVVVDASRGSADPALNLSDGLAMSPGKFVDLTLTAVPDTPARRAGIFTLVAPNGTITAGTLPSDDLAHPGALNATFFSVTILKPGVWSVRGPDGLDVRFRVGAARVAVGTATSLSLAPGATASVPFAATLDNALLRNGWQSVEMEASAVGFLLPTRASFTRAAALHLDFPHGAPTFGFVTTDGVPVARLGDTSATSITILTPPGNATAYAGFGHCPSHVPSCPTQTLTHAHLDDIVVEGELRASLHGKGARNAHTVTVPTSAGALSASALPTCSSTRGSGGPCLDLWATRVMRTGEEAWPTYYGWVSHAFEDFDASWSLSTSVQVRDGGETLVHADRAKGLSGPFHVERPAGEEAVQAVEYALLPDRPAGARVLECIDLAFGVGGYRAVADGVVETWRVNVPRLLDEDLGGSQVAPIQCKRLNAYLYAGLSDGLRCSDPAGCPLLALSRPGHAEAGAYVQERHWLDASAYDARGVDPDGALVLSAGAPLFEGDVQGFRAGFVASIDFLFGSHAASSGPFHYTKGPQGARYEIRREGALVASGPIGFLTSATHASGGNISLNLTHDGAILETGRGNVTETFLYDANAFQGELAKLRFARVRDADGMGTRFRVGEAREVAFRFDHAEGQTFNVRVAKGATSALVEGVQPVDGLLTAAIPELGVGAHDLVLEAVAPGGRTSRVTLSPAYHVTGPIPGNLAPTVVIDAPTPAATVSRFLEARGRAIDVQGNWTVETVEYSLDGGAWTPANGRASWVVPLDTYAMANGTHTLAVRASDGEAWSSEATVLFTVRNSAIPVVQVQTPVEGAVVRGFVPLKGNVTDPDDAFLTVEFSVGGGPWSRATGIKTWNATIDAASFPAGETTLRFRAFDGDRYSAVVERNVTILPNEAPLVAILAPSEGVPLDSHVRVSGTASDADGNGTLRRVEVQIADGPWLPAAGTGNWSFTFYARDHPEGDVLVRARAWDGVLPSDVATRTLTLARLASDLRPVTVTPSGDILVNVTNAGAGPSPATTVAASVEAQLGSGDAALRTREDLGTLAVPPLEPGEWALLVFRWDRRGNAGDQHVLVEVDPEDAVAETDESNNDASLTVAIGVGGRGGVALDEDDPAGDA